MDDPYCVRSVKKFEDYIPYMKLHGVPLLPPLLSYECKKEMNYYKLLAMEVEKRISILGPLKAEENNQDGIIKNSSGAVNSPSNSIGNPVTFESSSENSVNKSIENSDQSDASQSKDSVKNQKSPSESSSPRSPSPVPFEMPERDCDCATDVKIKTVDGNKNTSVASNSRQSSQIPDINNRSFTDDSTLLSMKSFTGSLGDIHSESNSIRQGPLVRQRSYTVLKPCPHLMAHLEDQAINTGVAVTSISMSEFTPQKKRRSWDLEMAKSSWSMMAHELNTDRKYSKASLQKTKVAKAGDLSEKRVVKTLPKSEPVTRMSRKSLTYSGSNIITQADQSFMHSSKTLSKSEPAKPAAATVTLCKKTTTTKIPGVENIQQNIISIPDLLDPSIRNLYENIQKQQLLQMASLVEKQKKEQMLLQQVFEQQNMLLYKQLKTICPQSPTPAKEAWAEAESKGPVSLSQLINQKTPEPINEDTISTTLSVTKNHLMKSESVLKRSRDISNSLLKKAGDKSCSPSKHSAARTHSPSSPRRSPRRRIVYESSSSDREFEPLMTDRTNDTMADVNVTFSTDDEPFFSHNDTVVNKAASNGVETPTIRLVRRLMDSPNRFGYKRTNCREPPTEQQRAAASTIVAYCRGYLTRRLMRTERVQSTVQTIKDALLCALQLHQDRQGIRGADVDLHRRLIQQITAACHALHETVVASSPEQRCSIIAADRARRAARAKAAAANRLSNSSDVMSKSHSGAFPARGKRSSLPATMTQSHHEMFSESSRRSLPMRRRPWR